MLGKRGYNYYEMFKKVAGYACEASQMLQTTIDNYKVEVLSRKITEIHNIEHTADAEKHEMLRHLLKEFLPPIEREDIIRLAEQVDNVVDSIEEILMRLYMYNIKSIRHESYEFVKIISKSTATLRELMNEFPHFRKSSTIHKYIVELNDMEEEGDRLYTAALRRLYVESQDPIEVIAWTQVFECFENCCDVCEEVADIVESIIMKNI
ncbi:putative phosphate transport protein (TIGR00153 family) [Caldicoprobacter guelmensis]|uniref:DUF47 domain-containing protein n=1 Tax=Caldicoprobacter guelmensis TaxID=1170224 RepID=UPI00195C16BF|nr:DUF47 family protein [Caldicoprobacter guelmensis]MBM7583152.1 putative phosphate transport protein (TIGR00153 family) [Caldicoprobacter guelmensis]